MATKRELRGDDAPAAKRAALAMADQIEFPSGDFSTWGHDEATGYTKSPDGVWLYNSATYIFYHRWAPPTQHTPPSQPLPGCRRSTQAYSPRRHRGSQLPARSPTGGYYTYDSAAGGYVPYVYEQAGAWPCCRSACRSSQREMAAR